MDLIINRTFNAPLNKVWEVWTDTELIKCWWGPKSFTAPFAKIDFKVGGKYILCMRSAENVDYWSAGEFQEIKPMESIVYTDSFSDEKGNMIPAAKYGMQGDWPNKLLVTLTFKETSPNKTTFSLSHSGMPDEKNRDLARDGWNESLDKLENCLK